MNHDTFYTCEDVVLISITSKTNGLSVQTLLVTGLVL